MKKLKKILPIFVIMLVVTGLIIGGLMLTKKSKQDSLEEIIIRIGYAQIKPNADMGERVRLAVEQNNQKARLEGLEDDLNPEVLDLAKVEVFLEGLPKLPEEILGQLRGRVLYLNAPTLYLGTATGITAETLRQGYTLVVSQVAQGGVVQPTLKATVDKNRAQDLVMRARPATAAFNQKVEKLEATVDKDSASELRQLSLARSQRFAVSIVWKNNSLALLQVEPENEIFKADAEKAKKAAAEYVAPSWIGMPKE
ncbi:MAG TPA: hypothetical protein VMX76_01460 [Nevskiaceae bacterium]|nr:hypothetical protein [Nevskiaceae bacterium]